MRVASSPSRLSSPFLDVASPGHARRRGAAACHRLRRCWNLPSGPRNGRVFSKPTAPSAIHCTRPTAFLVTSLCSTARSTSRWRRRQPVAYQEGQGEARSPTIPTCRFIAARRILSIVHDRAHGRRGLRAARFARRYDTGLAFSFASSSSAAVWLRRRYVRPRGGTPTLPRPDCGQALRDAARTRRVLARDRGFVVLASAGRSGVPGHGGLALAAWARDHEAALSASCAPTRPRPWLPTARTATSWNAAAATSAHDRRWRGSPRLGSRPGRPRARSPPERQHPPVLGLRTNRACSRNRTDPMKYVISLLREAFGKR